MKINRQCRTKSKLIENDKVGTDQLSTIIKGVLNTNFLILTFLILGNFSCSAQRNSVAVSLFDGTTLTGWETVKKQNASLWKVTDSTLIGGDGTIKIPENTYLYTTQQFQDFEFRFLFKLTGDHSTGLINSGVQYRSIIKDNHIIGYQADIGKGYWGDIYDEHRRGKLVSGDLSTLKHILNEDGWNSYIIRCVGNKHELYINGVKTVEYLEKDSFIPSKGVIGIQLHSGGNAKIEFKHITITEL
ncbi:DUF1080 domain-containing protein [Cellulophaga sp. F20128]|uniref:3-keto-disaccharide hydrolase n=1 Tax=Cellulophaga sp. F20128 TaxID=2926413 RepID=UPI001FF53C27|nr:DUF1080 domain-containing protein [Cellulophaga sp. F20128]MCK0158288.1 DUF1080 domain-containing protein [Cellulophaga sp. F20128]